MYKKIKKGVNFMNLLVDKMQEYVISVFTLRANEKECLFPIDNPIVENLLDDEILYHHFKRGDTSAIKARIKESIEQFCYELDNQATGNWIYDLTYDLSIPKDEK